MSVQYAPSKLRVPPGFQNLLEGLSREVLREQPPDIIRFAADYFKQRLALAKETGQNHGKTGERMENLASEAAPTEELELDLRDPIVARAAGRVQAAFQMGSTSDGATKNLSTNKQIDGSRHGSTINSQEAPLLSEDEAAVKIQAAVRGHLVREEIKGLKSQPIKNPPASENVTGRGGKYVGEGGYADENPRVATLVHGRNVTEEERLSRPGVAVHGDEASAAEDDIAATMSEDEAATKIQANFRGYNARKKANMKRRPVAAAAHGDLVDDGGDEGDFEDEDSIPNGGSDDLGVDTSEAPFGDVDASRADGEFRGNAGMDGLAAVDVGQVVNTEVDVDAEAAADSVDATDGPGNIKEYEANE